MSRFQWAGGDVSTELGRNLISLGSVSGTNLGALAEGADLVLLQDLSTGSQACSWRIQKSRTPTELKGKSFGVNSLSGGGWIFSMLMLDYWGLVPERDKIQFRTLGEQAVMARRCVFSGLHLRQDDREQRFQRPCRQREVADIFQGSGLMARRSFVTSSPAAVDSVLRALLDSVAFIRNPDNKTQVTQSLAKALRFRRVEDAEDGYCTMVNLYERRIYPSVDGIRNVIRLLGADNEKIRPPQSGRANRGQRGAEDGEKRAFLAVRIIRLAHPMRFLH